MDLNQSTGRATAPSDRSRTHPILPPPHTSGRLPSPPHTLDLQQTKPASLGSPLLANDRCTSKPREQQKIFRNCDRLGAAFSAASRAAASCNRCRAAKKGSAAPVLAGSCSAAHSRCPFSAASVSFHDATATANPKQARIRSHDLPCTLLGRSQWCLAAHSISFRLSILNRLFAFGFTPSGCGRWRSLGCSDSCKARAYEVPWKKVLRYSRQSVLSGLPPRCCQDASSVPAEARSRHSANHSRLGLPHERKHTEY